MSIERVLSWSILEKFVYYNVDKVEYYPSKFHDGTVAVVTINQKKYYFPVGMTSVLDNFIGKRFIIFPGQKIKCYKTNFLKWDISFYKNTHMVIVHDYEDVKAKLKAKTKCNECDLVQYGLGPENQMEHECMQRLEQIGPNYKDVLLEKIILDDPKYRYLPATMLCNRFKYMDDSVNTNQVSVFINFSYEA